MNIVGVASNNHSSYSNIHKTNRGDVANLSSVNIPLTDEELDLAKEFKDYLDYSSSLSDIAKNGYISEEDREKISKSKSTQNRFNNVISAMGVNFINPYEAPPQMGEEPSFEIPKGNASINSFENSINLTRGGRINISGGYIYIADGHVSTFPNNMVFGGDLTEETCYYDYTRKGYSNSIKALIGAVESGNSRFTKEVSDNVLNLLSSEMGIDITKDIKINGVEFEVVDGCLQTKGYVKPEEEKSLGSDYLQGLLEKAYEQNLL